MPWLYSSEKYGPQSAPIDDFYKLNLTILNVETDNDTIIFHFDGYKMTCSRYDDCCSEGYFCGNTEMTLSELLEPCIGGKIRGIKRSRTSDSSTLEDRPDTIEHKSSNDHVKVNYMVLKYTDDTDQKQTIDFFMVNESNGYYDSTFEVRVVKTDTMQSDIIN